MAFVPALLRAFAVHPDEVAFLAALLAIAPGAPEVIDATIGAALSDGVLVTMAAEDALARSEDPIVDRTFDEMPTAE